VLLAEIPYPRIPPDVVTVFGPPIRWYGVSYVVAFALAYLVLKGLARRGRWPVDPARVADVLFWGIVGVFVGGRLGWVLFYGLPSGAVRRVGDVFTVWEGGMSFHGGLLGVVVAYWIYTAVRRLPRGVFFDGLTLATPLGILCVRLANFVNAELYGRPWDGPFAMRFPRYTEVGGPAAWEARLATGGGPELYTEPRHPSQLYEAFGEGLFLFLVLRWLMLRRGVGGGRIAGLFLVGYGLVRFLVEFAREPDPGLGLVFLGFLTRGQQLSLAMALAGAIVLTVVAAKARRYTPAP